MGSYWCLKKWKGTTKKREVRIKILFTSLSHIDGQNPLFPRILEHEEFLYKIETSAERPCSPCFHWRMQTMCSLKYTMVHIGSLAPWFTLDPLPKSTLLHLYKFASSVVESPQVQELLVVQGTLEGDSFIHEVAL
ncbi:hypothetical protein Ccrd_018139 [Cynara cardunculus var. scolymus]|uniref:Uncharacterized protein n=1 Tax=Cynara cardunculus var. scolymus TaxID=59895 RepID=A0A103Y6T6_CYNCS|nr:hypothetical protein Ccrd_018139 [Cynara cardunculus var. scolymus]